MVKYLIIKITNNYFDFLRENKYNYKKFTFYEEKL